MTAKEFNRLLGAYKTDPSSVDSIYNYFFPRIVSELCEFYDFSVAEDAANEFFMRLFVIEPVGYVARPSAWIYSEAEKIAAEKGVRRVPDTVSELGRILSTYGIDCLCRSLEQIDDDSYKILELSFVDGYRHQEIAEIMDMSYDAVRQKYSRAVRKLKKLLSGC